MKKGMGHFWAFLSIILVVIVFGGAYYLIIAPQFIDKPDILSRTCLSMLSSLLVKEYRLSLASISIT